MNKATKGPWKIQTDGKGFWWIDKITRDGGFSICNCGTSKEAEANARLIAAAPELLDACKAFMKEWDNPESNGNPDEFVSNLHDKKVTHNIRQAIAKAEGTSNA